MSQPSEPGIAPRRSAGIRPARTTEDLPLPLGPTTARNRVCASRLTSSSTSSSRPKKSAASPSSNARRPLYGFATIAPGTAGARVAALATERPPERHVVRGVVRLGPEPDHMDRVGEALEADRSAVDVGDALDLPREVRDRRAGEELGRRGDPAESSSQVERPAPVAVVDGHRLPRVQADPDRERQRRIRHGLVDEAPLQLDRRPDRLSSGVEHGHDLVAAELQVGPAPRLEDRAGHGRELAGQLGGGLVAALLREDGVPADVGDQERPDMGVAREGPRRRPWGIMVHAADPFLGAAMGSRMSEEAYRCRNRSSSSATSRSRRASSTS